MSGDKSNAFSDASPLTNGISYFRFFLTFKNEAKFKIFLVKLSFTLYLNETK